MLRFLPSWRMDGGDSGWPRSVLLLEVVPCALTAFPAPRCGSPCHLPGPRAGPQAGSPAQGRLLPPPPWAAEPPGSLQASWPVLAQGQGSEAGRGQRQAATPPNSVAPSFHMLLLHSCAGGRASPCAGPSCHSICQQHPRVAPALVLSQPGSPRTAPTSPALQSHSPCSVALCCWHIPSCAPGGTPTRCWKRVLSRLTCLCTRRLGSRGKEGQRRQQVRGERSCPAGSSQVRAGAGAAAPQVLQLPLCLLPLPGWRGWGPQWGSQAGPTGH